MVTRSGERWAEVVILLAWLLVSSACGLEFGRQPGVDSCPGGVPRESKCEDSGIRITNADGGDYDIDETCVEKAKYEGYEVVPVSAQCAWVVCLDTASNDSCPAAMRNEVYNRWLQIAEDSEHPFGFRSNKDNRYNVICAPTRPVDEKCCFLLAVEEATC